MKYEFEIRVPITKCSNCGFLASVIFGDCNYCCGITEEDILNENKKPSWCPLKEV